MKGLLVVSVMVGAIAMQPTALAESLAIQMEPMSVPAMEPTPTAEMQQQSEALVTEPVAVRRPGEAIAQPVAYDQAQLRQVSRSITAQPGGSSGGIGIPKDLFYAPPPYSSDTDPLGFFKVPGPTPSYGINLNAIQ